MLMLSEKLEPTLVTLLHPRRFTDPRGWFMETWSERRAAEAGIRDRFVQDNASYSIERGTVRGLHCQRPPLAQAKLVRCVAGSIMDYAVDVRRGSPTFGQFAFAMLSAENACQIYVPVGFAHGFVTLEPHTEIAYKVSKPYSLEHEMGLAWDCPDIGIDWPLPPSGPILSDKDAALANLADFDSPFPYNGVPMAEFGNLAVSD